MSEGVVKPPADFEVDQMTLEEFFRENPEAAVAFSGGVDSAFLLHEAVRLGKRCTAYYVETPFQPAFEGRDARETAAYLDAQLRVLPVDILMENEVVQNPENRCYYCKKRIFSAIAQAAVADGYTVILDGTNASDDASDRPGMRALRELQVLSPLRMCGVTKEMVRSGARRAGLAVWDKPSYACLATRIPTGTPITAEDLRKVEWGEERLMAMGFRDFRLRLRHGGVLQVSAGQLEQARKLWPEIRAALDEVFPHLMLDDTPRATREN